MSSFGEHRPRRRPVPASRSRGWWGAGAALLLLAAGWWTLTAQRCDGPDCRSAATVPGEIRRVDLPRAAMAPVTEPSSTLPAATPPSGTGIPLAAPVMAEPSGELRVPEPVPMQRTARVARTLPADALSADAALGDGAARAAAAGRDRQVQWGGTPMSEADLGLKLYPQARQDVAEATRVEDRGTGRLQATVLVTRDGMAQIADFYREQLRNRNGSPPTESHPSPEQWHMEAVDASGTVFTALVWRDGAEVRVALSRWQPPSRPVSPGG